MTIVGQQVVTLLDIRTLYNNIKTDKKINILSLSLYNKLKMYTHINLTSSRTIYMFKKNIKMREY